MSELVTTALHTPWRALSVELPAFLLLLVVVPGIAYAMGLRGPGLFFSRTEASLSLPRGNGEYARFASVVAIAAGLSLLILAIAGPIAPGLPDPRQEDGIDIVTVLDVSGSMRAADFKPRDRLTVAKRVIDDYLLSRSRDRIGLVIFAGEAFTQAPLTRDRKLLAEILAGVRTGIIKDGTAIGDAVATGVNRLRDSEAKSKVLILVTDGDNNAGELSPEVAAALAKEFDVKIYPILVGRGGRVPFPSWGGISNGYVYRDVAVNPALLKDMAKITGGEFFSAENPQALKTSFQTILQQMEKSRLDAGQVLMEPIPLYPLPLLLAIFFLTLGLVLRMTRALVVP